MDLNGDPDDNDTPIPRRRRVSIQLAGDLDVRSPQSAASIPFPRSPAQEDEFVDGSFCVHDDEKIEETEKADDNNEPTFVSGLATEQERAQDEKNFEGEYVRADAYQDVRVFAPIVQDKVTEHSSGLTQAKWLSRICLLAVTLGICATLVYMVIERQKKEAETEQFYGFTNSSVMRIAIKGRMQYFHEPHFLEAVSLESGVDLKNVLLWDAWEVYLPEADIDLQRESTALENALNNLNAWQIPNAVHLHFQLVELSGVKAMERAVSLLAGVVSRDVALNLHRHSSAGGFSSFRTAGLWVIAELIVNVDLLLLTKPPLPPDTPAPDTMSPPRISETQTITLSENPDGVQCGDIPKSNERCALALILDKRTGRCACKWTANERTVCSDYQCVTPQWKCTMTHYIDTCGVPFVDCRSACESIPFCTGFIHDARKPFLESCQLSFRKGLGLPAPIDQLLPFATQCTLDGRYIPKKVTIDRFAHLILNQTRDVVYLTIDRQPTKGKLYVTPSAPGITFIPFQVFFDTSGITSRPIVVEAKESVLDNNGQHIFTSTIGTALPGGGYKVKADFIKSGPAESEYEDISSVEISLSKAGRNWIDTDFISGSFIPEGVGTTLGLTLSVPVSYNVSIAVTIKEGSGILVLPPIATFAALSEKQSVELYGLVGGEYTIQFAVVKDAAGQYPPIDNPPEVVVFVPIRKLGVALKVQNVAIVGTANQSSVEPSCASSSFCGASAALDGKKLIGSPVAMTRYSLPIDPSPWWSLTLPRVIASSEVLLHNRKDCCLKRFRGITCVFYIGDTEVARERLLDQGTARFSIRKRPLLVFDRLIVLKDAVEGDLSMDSVLNLLEVEVMSPDTQDLPPPPAPVVVTAVPLPTQVAPVVLTADQTQYEVAWIGVVNQSSIFSKCDGCAPSTAVNHHICTGPEGENEYTMTSSDVHNPDTAPWFVITFPTYIAVHRVLIHNRRDCCQERLRDITVTVVHDRTTMWDSGLLNPGDAMLGPAALDVILPTPLFGNKVNISKTNPASITNIDMVLSLAEVQVYTSTKVDPSFFPATTTLLKKK